MIIETNPVVISIVDSHHFRRAGIAFLLSDWAIKNNIQIHEIEAVDRISASDRLDCRMCILVVGGDSLSDLEVQLRIRLLQRIYDQQPLILITDLEDDMEVQRAYDSGVRGLISTKMPPNVAVAAINFILSGGSYFPPLRLRSSIAGGDGEGDRGQPEYRPVMVAAIENGAGASSIFYASARGGSVAGARDPEMSGTTSDPGIPRHVRESTVLPPLTTRQGDVLAYLRAGKSNKEIARALDLSEATVKIHVRQLMKKLGVSNRTQVAIFASGQVGGTPAEAERPLSTATHPVVRVILPAEDPTPRSRPGARTTH